MSGRLVSAVFDSALPAWLKPYAAAFASFAADDGSRCFPTVKTVAAMVGHTERATRMAVFELREIKVLKAVSAPGRYLARGYQFNAAALPQRTDGVQLPLFPQGFPQAGRRGFPQDPQPWVKWASAMGEVGFTRSVSDPSRASTHLRARVRTAEGKYQKTGTR